MRIGILTSGGDAPGMNAAIRSAVRQADALGIDVFGIWRGYQGLVDQDWRPLTSRSVANILQRGGTILNTARCDSFRIPAVRAQAVRDMQGAKIDALLVIGGDGSFTGAHLLHEEHGIRCAGIPGTIDNDLPGTERTLGFDTALNTAVEAVDRIRDTAFSHERVFLVEVMGRSSGMIAVHTAIACGADAVLYPESAQDGYQAVVDQLRAGWERGKRSSIVIVAEGDRQGNAFDVGERLRREHHLDLRVVVLGHVQRGGSPCASDRILGSLWGAEAIRRLAAGESGFFMGMQEGKILSVPLARIWEPRPVPPAILTDLVPVMAR